MDDLDEQLFELEKEIRELEYRTDQLDRDITSLAFDLEQY